MNKLEIINRIGYIRARAKLTQKGLSRAIGMNDNYVNRLESKKDFVPSLEVLLKIIEVCGSKPEEFFYHDISMYEQEIKLSEKIKTLPDEVKEFVLNYDPEIMNLFVKLNEKAIKLNESDKKKF